jgi:hypothetical protein
MSPSGPAASPSQNSNSSVRDEPLEEIIEQPLPEHIAPYRSEADRFGAERDALDRPRNLLANFRLLAMVVTIVALIWFLLERAILPGLVFVVGIVIFALLVRQHRAIVLRQRRAALLSEINGEGVARYLRDWDALPLRHEAQVEPNHPFANDLDLFGRASLFHLLDTVTTPMGERTLRSALLEPADPAGIVERQEAIRELAPQRVWREELQLQGRLAGEQRTEPEAFLAWAEGPVALSSRRWLVWLARLGLLATIVTAVLVVFDQLPISVLGVVLVFNLIVSQLGKPDAGERLDAARSQHHAIGAYAGILAHCDDAQFQSPMLARMHERLLATGLPAHVQVARLGRLTSWIVPRGSLAHLPLQAVACWDIHVLDFMERWQRRSGRQVRGWLEAIGEFESLTALATLTYDNPAWAFPTVRREESSFDGETVGHPLLADFERVTNDVVVGPPETFLLVTGSNMSGKSTLLRSIGINIVLSGAGAPVCATSLRTPPVILWTSVRVTDSLEQGVSFYMAELLRLKAIVDAAAIASKAGVPFCYLLDEILQGTNTAERQIAARHIIAQLVGYGAIGAVSTHDLQLADGGELVGLARPVHFSDRVGQSNEGPTMTFDYVLRPGLATSTNALRLMEIVGFDLPESAREESRAALAGQ